MTNKNRDEVRFDIDPDTEAWLETKPKWFVTTLCICEKCGLSYKASIGHKPENCKVKE